MGDKCSHCGNESTRHGYAGSAWCAHCGISMPCACWQERHEDCIKDLNEFRKKSGYPLATECCCGKSEVSE